MEDDGVHPGVMSPDRLRTRIGRLARRVGLGRSRELQRSLREQVAITDALRVELKDALTTCNSIIAELAPEGNREAGEALRLRLEHSLLHAESLTSENREHFERELAYLRSSTRLTQALVERALQTTTADSSTATGQREPPAASQRFRHPVPSFDVLYRSFEDRHRGNSEEIAVRARDDYEELLEGLPNPELAIADLGCGRGELVRLLAAAGVSAVGVESNLGQIVEADRHLFVEADLLGWLDEQPDQSLRAVMALHVIEHLPLELQTRLVFEARRVLADGGCLVLETPNALSLSTAATNFWVDPTHERPVHPYFLEFLAREAGFHRIEHRPLHPLPTSFPTTDGLADLVDDLNSLIFGAGDAAIVAWR